MGYTQTDLDNVIAAILDLATGKRVAKVTVGDRSTDFTSAQLPELRKLRMEIDAEVSASLAPVSTFFLASTRKGL